MSPRTSCRCRRRVSHALDCLHHDDRLFSFFLFFFNDTATTEIYTLSLHDALPISFPFVSDKIISGAGLPTQPKVFRSEEHTSELQSRFGISYAVFCLKKKKKN